ncbi:MAG: amidohydrolase family protein [Acidobacteria bacterium]|jgi:cytosine/adenosine deaminase-related metal-dependent hydrolase|nr:amidohydrolase family protein [Acidobacteriota bacterium]
MFLLKNFYILSPHISKEKKFEFYKGHLFIKDGKIADIYQAGKPIPSPSENIETMDGHFRKLIFPGFIQSHIHFCQTLHRNLAEQLPLIKWLQKEIWPYEAALTPDMMKQSVFMSLKEVLSTGVTSVLDMGTIHHQDVIFQIMETVGFRYTGGKAMMDQCSDAPEKLTESLDNSIAESMKLYEQFHGKNNGLLHYAFAPRFVLSCSPKLLQEVKRLSDQYGFLIHTHASEHPEEVAFIKETTGYGNVAYLEKLGALNRNCVIAHMIHLDETEKKIVKDYDIAIAHCPSANLKLGSGIAPIPGYLENDIRIGLGSDGAPCNNGLNIFNELKLAPLLQKGLHNNPLLMTPEDALRMVSIDGARIIRQEHQVGRIAKNMDADLVLLDMDTPQTFNFEKNPTAALVYGADPRNVFATMVRGKFLYREGRFDNCVNQEPFSKSSTGGGHGSSTAKIL